MLYRLQRIYGNGRCSLQTTHSLFVTKFVENPAALRFRFGLIPNLPCQAASARAPAIGPHPEHGLCRFAEYALLLRFAEVCAFNDFARLRIADREGRIRPEHDALGRSLFGEILERIRIEHAGVEVHG